MSSFMRRTAHRKLLGGSKEKYRDGQGLERREYKHRCVQGCDGGREERIGVYRVVMGEDRGKETTCKTYAFKGV
jgi:hypothetical protein